MKSPADRQATVDKVWSVLPPRRCPETIPDLTYPLDTGEKAGQECLEGDAPVGNHRPEGFGKIVGSPAELIGVVEDVGEELRRATCRSVAGAESLMVADRVDDGRAFVVPDGKRGQERLNLFGSPLRVIFLGPADIVEDAGEL